MSPTFWSHTVWYLLLAASSVVSMILVLVKSRNRKLAIAFTCSTIGFMYMLEAVLIILLHAYTYSPKLINDRFQDAVFGNIISQLSISSTSALMLAFGLHTVWYFIFAAVYCLIEIWFVKMGIFHHFWYRSVYTFIGLVPFFWLVSVWFRRIRQSPNTFLYNVTLLPGAFALAGNTIIMPLKVSKIQIFKVNFFPGLLSKNHTSTAILYGLILLIILICLFRWKTHGYRKGIVLLLLAALQYALYRAGLIYVKAGWFAAATVLDILGFYLWIILLDYLYGRKFSRM